MEKDIKDKSDFEQVFEIIEKQYANEQLDSLIEASKLVCKHFEEKHQLALVDAVLAWWEEHQYDTTSTEEEEYNVYDEEPEFVKIAKRIKDSSLPPQ